MYMYMCMYIVIVCPKKTPVCACEEKGVEEGVACMWGEV